MLSGNKGDVITYTLAEIAR